MPSPRMTNEQYNSIGNINDLKRVQQELGMKEPIASNLPHGFYQGQVPYGYYGTGVGEDFKNFYDYYPEGVQKQLIEYDQKLARGYMNRKAAQNGQPLPFPNESIDGVANGYGYDQLDGTRRNRLMFPKGQEQWNQVEEYYGNLNEEAYRNKIAQDVMRDKAVQQRYAEANAERETYQKRMQDLQRKYAAMMAGMPED